MPLVFLILLLACPSACATPNVSAPTNPPNNPDFFATEILGRPTNTSVTVNVVPNKNLELYFEYGTASGNVTNQTATVTANASPESLMDKLSPNTRYFYRARYRQPGSAQFAAGNEHAFVTPRAPGSSFTFSVQGDSHSERLGKQFDPALYTRALQTAASDQSDFYMLIGDDFSVDNLKTINVNTVTERYTLQCEFLGLIGSASPLFLVNGNHEQAAKYNLDGMPNNVAVWAQIARHQYYAEIVIEPVQSNTQYFYQVFYRAGNAGAFTALAEKSFDTQRAPGASFTFAVQADSHLDSNSNLDVYARTLANELADKPDFLIDLGDTFMTDKDQPYTASQNQYLAQRYFFGTRAPLPLFLVLGNHDGEGAPQNATLNDMSTWAAKWRTQYFPNPTPNDFYSGNATPDKIVGALQNYYAWEWGGALFVVLDSYTFTPPSRGNTSDNWNPPLGAAQYQWLKKTFLAVNVHLIEHAAPQFGRDTIAE